MAEEKKVNTENDDEQQSDSTSKKEFSILKKCKCNSGAFHSVGEYYIVGPAQEGEVSNDEEGEEPDATPEVEPTKTLESDE